MRVAILGNLDKEISINSAGGTEIFTYTFVNELANHDSITSIDVYGVGGNYFTNPKIKFISLLPSSATDFIKANTKLNKLNTARGDILFQFRFNLALKAFNLLLKGKYDVIHDNSTISVYSTLNELLTVPLITTLHTNANSPSVIIPYSLDLISKNSKQYFVAIANHQSKYATNHNIDVNIVETIYNGITPSDYPFSIENTTKNHGLWIGRISKKHNKGLKQALMATQKNNTELVVLSSVDDTSYYESDIKPYLHGKVTFISKTVNHDEKIKFYQDSKYLLYPIMWEEPFGLVFLESMACGTPLIAFAKGSVPEIIKDGITGFIVNSSDDDIRGDWIVKKTGIEGLCEAIEKINSLSEEEYKTMRKACQEHVEQNFTITKMVDKYVKVYERIIGNI